MKSWLRTTLEALNVVDTMDQPNGFTRLGYSVEEKQAMDVFTTIATQLGLDVRIDTAGNRIARWNATEEQKSMPAIAIGSHLDTVQNGGGYDGVAGILCALGAMKQLIEQRFTPTFPLEVICFASEESSRFGISTIGSKAMAGLLHLGELEHVQDEQGVTIRQAVESMGLDWAKMIEAERPQEAIKSFIELHIEQGMILHNEQAQFGSVQSIACPIRLIIQVTGRSGHTGTTPMNNRQDSLVAVAPLITFISERTKDITRETKKHLVATASTISIHPNAMSVIPEYVELGIDIRSVHDDLKEQIANEIAGKCEQLKQQYDVEITIDTLVNNASVHLAQPVVEKLQRAGERIGYSCLVMNSGAGHDVMNMAQKWEAGLLFIPCTDGISHHPKEHATLDDLAMGVDIITSYVIAEQQDE